MHWRSELLSVEELSTIKLAYNRIPKELRMFVLDRFPPKTVMFRLKKKCSYL